MDYRSNIRRRLLGYGFTESEADHILMANRDRLVQYERGAYALVSFMQWLAARPNALGTIPLNRLPSAWVEYARKTTRALQLGIEIDPDDLEGDNEPDEPNEPPTLPSRPPFWARKRNILKFSVTSL